MKIGRARAYTNIALIKYWGKRDEKLILPMNSSLSLTLDAFYTDTQVVFRKTLQEDHFFLDDQLQSGPAAGKVHAFLDIVREKAQTTLFAEVFSRNYVPTAAGLASSASGLAALAGASSAALGLDLSPAELSRLARRGSGSACRSIYGGLAEWKKGSGDRDSYAIPLKGARDPFVQELAMIFLVLDAGQKKISSRAGMRRTVETSVFYDGWIRAAEADLLAAERAINEENLAALGEATERSALRMHATTLGACPPFSYWRPETLAAMEFVARLREEGFSCWFTMDAGPNVKILTTRKEAARVKRRLAEVFSAEKIITAFAGPGIQIETESGERND
ncbi:MAG: diphosphomevalonate decarboxylase [Enterococcaceae bacterium]|jgi:diphosphomevalonate decarboxylase|nr:diphosphomevalonate decarboxylase [Enterococcaceae bacterium]MCI1919700.1 diphosphomevalonate decarboxylase [Enterococcaceae bacterium]